MQSSMQITVYNVVLVCIFGYGIVEKEMSSFHWLTYVCLSLVFFIWIGGIQKWENENDL